MTVISSPRLRTAHFEGLADKISAYAFVFVLGWAGCSAWDKVPELWQKKTQLEHVEKTEIPSLKRAAAEVPKLKKQVVVANQQVKTEHAHAVAAEQDKAIIIQALAPELVTPKPNPQRP